MSWTKVAVFLVGGSCAVLYFETREKALAFVKAWTDDANILVRREPTEVQNRVVEYRDQKGVLIGSFYLQSIMGMYLSEEKRTEHDELMERAVSILEKQVDEQNEGEEWRK